MLASSQGYTAPDLQVTRLTTGMWLTITHVFSYFYQLVVVVMTSLSDAAYMGGL